MPNREKLLLHTALLSAPLLSLVAVVLYSIALLRDFRPDTGYFLPDSPLPQALFIFFLCSFLLFLLLTLALRSQWQAAPVSGNLTVFFSAAFLAVSFVVSATDAFFHLASLSDAYTKTFTLLVALSALGALLYLILILSNRAPRLRAFTAMAPVFYTLFSAMLLYFDKTEEMNYPIKLLRLFAMLVLACWTLSECRNILGRGRPALHYLIGSFALVVSAAASLPQLIYGLVYNRSLLLSGIDDFVIFAFFLYILARQLQLLPLDRPHLRRMTELLLGHTRTDTERDLLVAPTTDLPASGEDADKDTPVTGTDTSATGE